MSNGAGVRPTTALGRSLGAVGLLGVLATVAILVVERGRRPLELRAGLRRGLAALAQRTAPWPRRRLDKGGFQALMLVMCASYLLVLAGARRLPISAILATILSVHLLLLLGPPLISRDVFGYLAFARMGALHGLDPYTHFPAAIRSDGIFPFIGWPYQHSPYGPLFTLASYALVPLGIAGALWALKALAVIASLVAVRLTSRAAERLGRLGLVCRRLPRPEPRAARSRSRGRAQRHRC